MHSIQIKPLGIFLAILGAILLTASQTWPHAGHEHEAEDPMISLPKVLARVNGVDIPDTFIWNRLKQIVKHNIAKGHRLTQAEENTEVKKLIQQEIRRELLLQRARELEIPITASMIEKKIQAIKSRFTSEAQFQKRLAAQHLTMDQYKEKLKPELLLDAVIQKEIEPQIKISPSELKTHYENNKKLFWIGYRVRASVILIKIDQSLGPKANQAAREKIDAVLKEARSGVGFAKLAKRHSQDSLAEKGGDLGYFTQKKMLKAFSDRAFKMEVGSVSESFQTQHGFHIIKVTDKKEGGYKPFEEASEKIKQILKEKKVAAETAAFVNTIKGKSDVIIYF